MIDKMPIELNSNEKVLDYAKEVVCFHNKIIRNTERIESKIKYNLNLTMWRLKVIEQAIQLYNLNEINIAYSGIYIVIERN